MPGAPYLPLVTSDIIIDLYHGNPVPSSFTAVRAAGIAAVILKADQGVSFNDPTFQSRLLQVIAAGLLPGAYHFFDASDPEQQVRHFMADIQATRAPGILRCVDFEPSPATLAIEHALAAFVINMGIPIVLYSGRWSIPVVNPILQQCPLWLAEYGTHPVCPPGWSQWRMWQHTDQGSVAGIDPVDRTRFAGTPAQLAEWWVNPVP